jgi:endonuclease YncB( thermonuclease family)
VFPPTPGNRGQRVRLLAMDAFEMRQLCKDARGADYRCGQQALQAMEAIVGGEELVCSGKGKDVFGRLVGTCTTAGTAVDVGEELVRQGWARAFRRYGQQYVPAEDAARKAGRGAWAGRFDEPWAFRKEARTHKGN